MRRRFVRVMAVLLGCAIVCGALPQPSFGLVNTADFPDYVEAPVTDPGWNYVGEMVNGTGVYLGDGWVLTANHVYQAQAGRSWIELDQHYDEIAGTTQRIKYNDSGVDADLVMFRINGNPQLYPADANGQPNLVKIRHARLSGSQLATIIGTGHGREFESTWGTVEIGGQTYKYFNTSKDRVKQWGTNWMSDYNDSVTPPGGYGTTEALYTMFDDVNRNEETQPVDKDSGSAAFVKRGLDWELAGIVLAYAAVEGYPAGDLPLKDHAVYDTGAMYADLSVYYDQISAIRLIPLPGDADYNGAVDIADARIFQSTFGHTGPDLEADFNNDDVVNLADFAILRSNYGMVSGGSTVPTGGAPLLMPGIIPEPTTVFILVSSVPLLLKSRKRRRTA
jgi:hypothetical protein